MMIEKEYLEKFIKDLEAPMWITSTFHFCEYIGEAISYPKIIPNKYWEIIFAGAYYENPFYSELHLPFNKKFTKKEMKQIQKEISDRIIEELSSLTYIIDSPSAFYYFSLLHALCLLKISKSNSNIPMPIHCGNFAYNIAYELFLLDDGTDEFQRKGYYICNQHDWAMNHLKEELTGKNKPL